MTNSSQKYFRLASGEKISSSRLQEHFCYALFMFLIIFFLDSTHHFIIIKDIEQSLDFTATICVFAAICYFHVLIVSFAKIEERYSELKSNNLLLLMLFLGLLAYYTVHHEIPLIESDSLFPFIGYVAFGALLSVVLFIKNFSPRTIFDFIIAFFISFESMSSIQKVYQKLLQYPLGKESFLFSASILIIFVSSFVIINSVHTYFDRKRNTKLLLTVLLILLLLIDTFYCVSFEFNKLRNNAVNNKYFEQCVLLKPGQPEAKYDLSIKPVTFIENAKFLEHVYSWKNNRPTNTVIATEQYTGNIYQSTDCGKTWHEVYTSDEALWLLCFTTDSNKHLLWNERSRRLHLFDPDWNEIRPIATGKYPWHGSWGIGEYDATIIYAEYTTDEDAKEVVVWRSSDDGNTWRKVFTQKTHGSHGSEIRHFHTVQPDPYNPGYWYLSSGDRPSECKIWLSTDDGLTWEEVTDPNPEGTKNQAVHRYTAIQFDENYLYWGTDDIMDGEAKFVRARRGNPLEVQVMGNVGNLVRTLTKTPYGLVFISQSKFKLKNKSNNATVYISPDRENLLQLGAIPNPHDYKTGFVYSKGSIASVDGVFFTYSDNKLLFPDVSRMLEWKIVPRL